MLAWPSPLCAGRVPWTATGTASDGFCTGLSSTFSVAAPVLESSPAETVSGRVKLPSSAQSGTVTLTSTSTVSPAARVTGSAEAVQPVGALGEPARVTASSERLVMS